jgi:hypothetical protein
MKNFSRSKAIWSLLAVCAAAGLAWAQSGDTSKVEKAATLTSTAEALAEMPDGSILITDNGANRVVRLAPNGELSDFAKLPAHAQVVIVTKDGFLVTGHERLPSGMRGGPPPAPAPSGGPMPNGFLNLGTQVIALDKSGAVVKTYPGGPESFFNGITEAGKKVLIADSIGGTIWQFDKSKGVQPWLKDDLLAPAPGGRGFPGANGIKAHGGWVYVSNTTRDAIYRVEMDGKGNPKGSLALFATITGPDDFDFAKDGSLYAPSGMSIVKISPAGEVTKFLDPVQGGATAMITKDQHWLYWGSRGPVPGAAPPPAGAPPGRGFMAGPTLVMRYPLN